MKCGLGRGAEAATVLPLRSAALVMAGRATMPSDHMPWSILKSCVVATPFVFHTIQVSAVVAAHWTSPEAMARWRSFCGIFWIVTSRPLALKMPASFASVSGAKPVQPEMPMATLVSCACTGAAAAIMPQTARVLTRKRDFDIGASMTGMDELTDRCAFAMDDG